MIELNRENALRGLTLYINGDVCQAGDKQAIERPVLREAIEQRGGLLSDRRTSKVDIVVLSNTLKSTPSLKPKKQHAWVSKPCLRSDHLADFLYDEPHQKAGPADGLFALVRLYKERAENAEIDLSFNTMGVLRRRFLWLDIESHSIRRRFPSMRTQRFQLLGMLPEFRFEWKKCASEGRMNLVPRFRVAEGSIKWTWTTKLDDGCLHTVFDSPYNSLESAVFKGEYESDEVFLWTPENPDSLTFLAHDVWDYLLLAERYQVRRGWMKDAAGLYV